MYRKFFVFISLISLSAVVSMAQDAPTPEKAEKKRAESVYRIALGGSGGYLGVELQEVSSANYQELGLSEVRGVAVKRVLKDSAAEKAGLQEGDVIVSFNGEKITSSRKFSRLVREVAPDHTVILTVSRGGGDIEIPVTMGKRKGMAFSTGGDFVFPEAPVPPVEFEFPAPPTLGTPSVAPRVRVMPDGVMLGRTRGTTFFSGRMLGVGVTSLTKQLGNYFGVEERQGTSDKRRHGRQPGIACRLTCRRYHR